MPICVPGRLNAGVSPAERISVRWAPEVGESPAEGSDLRASSFSFGAKGRLGGKWRELRLDSCRRF